MPSTVPPIAERIQRLFEPAARATRRGDPVQIRKVLDELRLIWKSGRSRKQAARDEELARGMTFALESVLGIVLATSSVDAQRSLVEGRKYALPILHALGRKARQGAQSTQSSATQLNNSASSIKKGELARTVGMLAQNIGELVNSMQDCGLVSVTDEGPTSRVAITETGLEILEAVRPGWQVQQVDQDTLIQRLDESLAAVQKKLQGFIDARQGAHSAACDFSISGRIPRGLILECKHWASPRKKIKHSEIPKGYKHKLYKDPVRIDVGLDDDLFGMNLFGDRTPLPRLKLESQS